MSMQICLKSLTGQCVCTGVVCIASVAMIEKVLSFNHSTGLSMQFSLKCFIMVCIHSDSTKKHPFRYRRWVLSVAEVDQGEC